MARTETLVQLNEAHLAGDHDAEISRRIVAGYERHPQATVDAWGDPSELADAATRALHRRLHTEEQAAGHDPS